MLGDEGAGEDVCESEVGVCGLAVAAIGIKSSALLLEWWMGCGL